MILRYAWKCLLRILISVNIRFIVKLENLNFWRVDEACIVTYDSENNSKSMHWKTQISSKVYTCESFKILRQYLPFSLASRTPYWHNRYSVVEKIITNFGKTAGWFVEVLVDLAPGKCASPQLISSKKILGQ